MRMKKLLTFLVLLCVSVGAWADATFSQIAKDTSNGKGFTYNHTTYSVELSAAGDLANYTYIESGASATVDNVEYGTYFKFSGPMNAADLQALSKFASDANVTNDVYFDFSDATFVDGEGNPLTDTSILTNLNNSKVKYLILPDNTESIVASDFPSNVLEAEAINPTTGQYLGYASPTGAGTLEHVIAFDRRNGKSDYNITDYTLVGTYTYQKDSNGNAIQLSTSTSAEPAYESVFSLLKNTGQTGFTNVSIEELDLSGASFPIYKDKNGNDMETDYSLSFTTSSNPTTWTDKHNAMELIRLYGGSLKSVEFPTDPNTKLIPYKALYDCNLVESYNIPGNIETIGGLAFGHYGGDNDKTALTSITFNEGLKYMNPDCFYNNQNLTEVNLPVGLTEVGKYAFTDCKALSTIVIPEGVTKLDVGCFHYTNITSIRLPNSLEVIESNAFRQCLSLTSVTIPANVQKIGSKAFYGSHNLTDIYVLGTTTIPECAADAFDGDAYRHHGSAPGTYTSESYTYGYEGYRDIVDLTTVSGGETHVHTAARSIVDPVDTWGYGVEKGAAILHYPQATQEAEYSSTAASPTEISAYIAAQDVDENQKLYYIEDGNYKRVFYDLSEEGTYYTIADDAWTPTTQSVSGVSAYYNSDGYYVTPFIKCGTQWDANAAPQYYEQKGTKPTYNLTAIHQPQTVDGTLVTKYYTKNGETYTESPLRFSQTKYHSPVESVVDNYVGTSQPVSGVTEYYASDGATNTVTPQLNQSLYYVSDTQTGGYVNTNREFKGGNTAYYIFNNSTSQYERVYPGFNGYTVYSDNAGNTQVYQMSSDVTTYYYKDYSDNTIKEIPNGLQVFDYYNTYYYYDENAVIPVYSLTSEYNSGTTYYYKDYAGSYIEQTSLQFNTTYYYKDGTKTVTTYTEATEWDPTVETYYTKNGDNYTAITSWSDNDFSGDYYYQTGTEPNYVSVCGMEYKPGRTYYTKNSDNTLSTTSTVNFNGTYYTLDVTKVLPVSSEVIAKIILKQSKTYAYKNGDEYQIVDAAYVQANQDNTYYEVLQTASDDVYGEYYTVPERNARYGGILKDGADDHGLTKWPDISDLYAYPGGIGEDGVHFDLINGRDYSGWKNFMLVGGYSVEKPDIVVPIENVKKDVWYTFCVPFDLTDAQLQSTFGAKYELAEFTGVTVDDAKETYTLNFTTDVKAVVKHHPYMIHPYSKAENADGTPAETSFTITGVDLTDEDLNAAPSKMIKVERQGPDGKIFTFVAYGHNYDNNSVVNNASPVVIPQWAFYLAQDPSLTYPKFYRQTGANSRTTGGRWTKNTAVVLPPTYEWSYTDSRSIYAADGSVLYGGDTGSAYYNYLCEEYKLEKEVPATGDTGVKSMFINFTNEPINHDADAIDIIEKTDAEQTILAEYMNKIFNLSGQMVGNNTDGLEKGIYIKNGKKFIVR